MGSGTWRWYQPFVQYPHGIYVLVLPCNSAGAWLLPCSLCTIHQSRSVFWQLGGWPSGFSPCSGLSHRCFYQYYYHYFYVNIVIVFAVINVLFYDSIYDIFLETPMSELYASYSVCTRVSKLPYLNHHA